jgi:hypothetical protein
MFIAWNRLAFARPFHTGNQHDHREALPLGQLVLSIEEGFAKYGHLASIGLLVDLVAELGRFEHGDLP